MSHDETTVVLDVREDLARGHEPLTGIMTAVRALAKNQCLKLISPFEPLPLFVVLKKLGFEHRSKQIAPDHWETLFAKKFPQETEVPAKSETSPTQTNAASGVTLLVDARGLEPPQPLVKILTELEKLQGDDTLRALTDRRPLHLLDALTERGFQSSSTEQPDGSWITLIHRN